MTIQIPTLPSKLQKIRTEIHALSQQERRVLMQALLAEESQTNGASAETPAEPIRFVVPVEPRSLESLGLPKGKPFTKLEDYVVDWWPEEETADDVNNFVRQMRQADLALELQRQEEYGHPLD